MPATVTQLQTLEIEATNHFLKGLQSFSSPLFDRITTKVKMGAKTIEAPIANMIGPLREWTGPRQVESLSQDAYAITAKRFEKTVGVPVDAFDDNNVGTFVAQLETLGAQVAAWPDQQVAIKLERGETDLCFDGVPFFSASHPVEHGNAGGGTYGNLLGTGAPAWYLVDTSKAVKPLIWGLRMAPKLTQLWNLNDPNVFWQDEYISGVKARGVADYGFPQCIFKHKGALDATNFEAAVVAMRQRVNGKGENLGINPNLLIIPPILRPSAQRLIERQFVATDVNNIHYKAIEWVEWQRLSNANQT